MKLQKVENKDKNYACSIAILKINGDFLNVLNYRNAICTIEDDVATDVLLEKKPQYKVCIGLNAIRKAYEEGQITNNEKFCYSAYDANDMFPSLKNMKIWGSSPISLPFETVYGGIWAAVSLL